jgi:hypothetical protein
MLDYKFNFEIANIPFSIKSNRKSIIKYFRKYLNIFETDRKPKFKIIFEWVPPKKIKKKFSSTIKLIKNKRRMFLDANEIKRKEIKNNLYTHLKIDPNNKMTKMILYAYFQIFVLTKIISNKSILLHCSAGSFNNQAIIFSGPCNEGKTTILRRLIKNNNFEPINEDFNVLVLKKNHINVYPFFRLQKTNFLIKNNPCKLHSLYFIKKSKNTIMGRLNEDEIITFLKLNTKHGERIKDKTFKKFAKNISAFELKHKKNEKIFEYLKLNLEN